MKTFLIAYEYKRCGAIEIQANSLEEAKELALEASVDNDPRNEFYVDESFQVDDEFSHEVRDSANESE